MSKSERRKKYPKGYVLVEDIPKWTKTGPILQDELDSNGKASMQLQSLKKMKGKNKNIPLV